MNQNQLPHYRSLLEKQLTSIRKTIHQQQEEFVEKQASVGTSSEDRATELETMEVDSSLNDSEFQLEKKILHALERIDQGSYGICECCGLEIRNERLEAKPSVSLCLPCQEKHEA